MRVIGNPGLGYTGLFLCQGPAGPVALFRGVRNPNDFSDAGLPNGRVTVNNADLGSVYTTAGNATLFVKTRHDATLATSGTWKQVTVR